MYIFVNPHAEKQEGLINAAMSVFGRNGYKKASVADIAEEAGAAKGMINYYFGSKKNLYLYLVDLSGRYMAEEMEKNFDPNVTDFFDNMKMMTNIKISLIKSHPAIFAFLTSLYTETDPEIKDEIQELIAKSLTLRERWILGDKIKSNFKDDADAKLIDKLLIWAAEGFMSNMRQELNINEIEKFTGDLFACLDIIKKYFYKNEEVSQCQN